MPNDKAHARSRWPKRVAGSGGHYENKQVAEFGCRNKAWLSFAQDQPPESLNVVGGFQHGFRGSRLPPCTATSRSGATNVPAVKVRRLALVVQLANCCHDDSLGRCTCAVLLA